MIKKTLILIGGIILLLLIFYVIINLDQEENPAQYTAEDLLPASFDYDNGYYKLWALCEPPGTDITSEAVLLKYRRLNDPSLNVREHTKEWQENDIGGKLWKGIEEHIKMPRISFPRVYTADLFENFKEAFPRIDASKERMGFLFERFRDIFDSERVEEFALPRFDTLVPRYLVMMRMSHYYATYHLKQALEGKWAESAQAFLAQVRFGSRFVPAARLAMSKMVVQAVQKHALHALNSLMNHPGCPAEVIRTIRESLPPIEYRHFGNSNLMIAEYIAASTQVDEVYRDIKSDFFSRLQFHPNRTKRYVFDYISQMKRYDGTPPYRWDKTLDELEFIPFKKGIAMVLRNLGGKVAANIMMPSHFRVLIVKSYIFKVLYDMTAIAAELHLAYTPGEDPETVLRGLESYKRLDPFSGKPYRWHKEKGWLYSWGIDGKDNDGNFKATTFDDSDIAVACILPRE